MVKQVNTNPVIFNPVARTLDFSAWASFDIRRLMAVINDSRNVLIYAVANNGIGLIKESSTNTLIKLQCDTTNHAPNDILTVLYDDALQFEITNFSITLPPNASTETKQDILNNKIVICDTSDVEITSSVLPTGGSTSQLQTVGNNSLSNLDATLGAKTDLSATTDNGTFSLISLIKRSLANWTSLLAKIPNLGSATKASSIPVNIASDQTVPVSGTFWQQTQPISGNVGVTNSSFQATQSTANNLLNKPCGYVTASPPVYLSVTDQPLSLNINGGLRVDGSSVVQPVLVNPSSNIIGNIRIDQTTNGTTNKVYSNISQINNASLSATNFLPSRITNGTSYIDPTQIRTLTTADNISSTQSGTWNLNNISGTISLPSGASTSSLQSAANTSLSSIDTKIPAKGQALIDDSLPVVLPLSQITALTPPTTINANIINLGQQTSNNSIPVVLANNQTALPITSVNYAQIVDDQTTFIYIGNSTVGSLASSSTWSIKKITFIGSLIKTEWASSTDLFDKIWDNRSTYIYS